MDWWISLIGTKICFNLLSLLYVLHIFFHFIMICQNEQTLLIADGPYISNDVVWQTFHWRVCIQSMNVAEKDKKSKALSWIL